MIIMDNNKKCDKYINGVSVHCPVSLNILAFSQYLRASRYMTSELKNIFMMTTNI